MSKKVNVYNNLAVTNPLIAKEWHPMKNGELNPYGVSYGSSKKVWWICEKRHEWQAHVATRTKQKTGCPYCQGDRACHDNCLETLRPELAKEWHPMKNSELTPKDVTVGSGKKVWWMCEKGHEWDALITNRTKRKDGCPYCSGRYVTKENSLGIKNKEISSQWHPTKNKDFTPFETKPQSNKKVWWLGTCGHEWEAKICNRVNGRGCPFCASKKIDTTNSLASRYPQIAKEWHPTKNEGLTPNELSFGSHKVVWWLCGRGHEWESRIEYRTKKVSSCSECRNEEKINKVINEKKKNEKKKNEKKKNEIKRNKIEKKRIIKQRNIKEMKRIIKQNKIKKNKKDNVLSLKYPELMKEWHQIKNGDLTPDKITCGSNLKVWWLCGKGHEWQTVPYIRIKGHGCPYCVGQKTEKKYSLGVKYKELSSQWHPTKNGTLTPYDFRPYSNLKAWWICEKGHEWESIISNRTKGRGCPYCGNKKANEENSFGYLFPDLAKEWNYKKNKKTPFDYTYGSQKMVHWICEKGHEWEVTINNRTNKGLLKVNRCPQCFIGYQTSLPEQFFLRVMEEIFDEVKNRFKYHAKTKKLEIDIYIPKYKIGIEYDGYPFHDKKSKIEKDIEKSEILKKEGIYLIRIRNEKLRKLEDQNSAIIIHKEKAKKGEESVVLVIKKLFEIINERVDEQEKKKMDNFFENTNISEIIEEVKEIMRVRGARKSILIRKYKRNPNPSSLEAHERLVKEWHPTKNDELLPCHMEENSVHKVWWMCEKGHEWKTSIAKRAITGTNCPKCWGTLPSEDNCLLNGNPKLANEWHPTKNGDLTPRDVTKQSGKKIWWMCKKGHEWETTVYSRNGSQKTNCPYCSNKRINNENCLATQKSYLEKEWNYDKNTKISPYDVSAFSSKKVWWICEKGHEWEAMIKKRSRGNNCPYCSGRYATKENNLGIKNTKLAKEWHPTKNNPLTPFEVKPQSNKKVWWFGECGHEWEAYINKRTKGTGCPICYKK